MDDVEELLAKLHLLSGIAYIRSGSGKLYPRCSCGSPFNWVFKFHGEDWRCDVYIYRGWANLKMYNYNGDVDMEVKVREKHYVNHADVTKILVHWMVV